MLNEQQTIAFNTITDFITQDYDPYNWCITLSGKAGTGKTYTIAQVLLGLDQERLANICISAPTHKAKNVINQALIDMGLRLSNVASLHSVLGMMMNEDTETGKQRCSKGIDGGVRNLDVLIIDECGMIDGELFESVRLRSYADNTRVVFLGDILQLPPIGSKDLSPTFGDDLVVLFLTQQMRNAGCIQTLAELSVQAVQDNIAISTQKLCIAAMIDSNSGKGSNVHWINTGSSLLIPRGDENDENEEDYMVLDDENIGYQWIASTNNNVNRIIKEIRTARGYGDRCMTENEEFVFYARYKDFWEDLTIPNGTTVKVVECKPLARLNVSAFTGIEPYLSRDSVYGRFKQSAIACILMLDSGLCFSLTYFPLWEEFIDELKTLAFKKKALPYKLYNKAISAIPQLKASCCLTVHKSQGSTYPKVVIFNDFNWAKRQPKALYSRLWYVSITRAKEKLVIMS